VLIDTDEYYIASMIDYSGMDVFGVTLHL